MDPSLFAAIADACLALPTDEALLRDLPTFLRSRGVPEEDITAVMSAKPAPRLATYRMLVRNNLESVTHRMLERTRARMGALFDTTFADFLAQQGPRTHHLRDVPHEFLAWAAPRWRALGDGAVAGYLFDLASHELLEFAVAAAPAAPRDDREGRGRPRDLALDRPLAFAETARLARYEHAVHELPADPQDTSTPPARPVDLLTYRDDEHTVRWLELTPLAARTLHHLLDAHEPLAAALGAACADVGVLLDDSALASTAHLLADLAERGVLLGATA